MIRIFLRLTHLAYALGFLLLLSSCDREEQVPSYIHIDKVGLQTNYLTQGSTSSSFTDAWVYVDDQFMGVYELPATFPVLVEGNHQIKVRGGIKVNGISATRAAYSMCTFDVQNIDAQKDKTFNLSSTVSYFSALQFRWLEDFENIGVSLIKNPSSDTSIQIISDTAKVFEGNYCGGVFLDEANPFFESLSSVGYTLPKGSDVFLELNYKCNNIFTVGVYDSNTGSYYPTLNINPSTEWKKIYVNLANEVGAANSGSSLNIFIAMTKDEGVEFPELYLDNFKLIHQ